MIKRRLANDSDDTEGLSRYIKHCKANYLRQCKANSNNNQSSTSVSRVAGSQFVVQGKEGGDSARQSGKAVNRAKVNAPKFQQLDVQNMTYTLMKDFSHLNIGKEEKFMERMKFDVYKRRIKEEKVNQLIDRSKLRLSETERIKGFNRLIKDANRRIEAQDNLDIMKGRLEDGLISPSSSRRYSGNEWNEIYDKRFKQYRDDSQRKIDSRCKAKQEEDKMREDQEASLCKVKKASMKHIATTTKRLYQESIIRRMKKELVLSKGKEGKDLNKRKKEVPHYLSDDDLNIQSKPKKIISIKKKSEAPKQFTNYLKEQNKLIGKRNGLVICDEVNNSKRRLCSSTIIRQSAPIMLSNQSCNYIEKYVEDDEIIKKIVFPKEKEEIGLTPSELALKANLQMP